MSLPASRDNFSSDHMESMSSKYGCFAVAGTSTPTPSPSLSPAASPSPVSSPVVQSESVNNDDGDSGTSDALVVINSVSLILYVLLFDHSLCNHLTNSRIIALLVIAIAIAIFLFRKHFQKSNETEFV